MISRVKYREGKPRLFPLAAAAAVGLLLAFALALYPLPPPARPWRQTPPTVPSPKPFAMPAPAVRTLANGLTILVFERRGLPVLTLRLVVKTGAEADPPDLPGTAQIVASLLDEGTEARSAQQIAQAIDQIGGSLQTGAEWDDSFGMVTVLSDHRELAFDILSDAIIH